MEERIKHWDSVFQWPKDITFEPWEIAAEDYVVDRHSPENPRYAKLFAAVACVIPENGYNLYADNNDDRAISALSSLKSGLICSI